MTTVRLPPPPPRTGPSRPASLSVGGRSLPFPFTLSGSKFLSIREIATSLSVRWSLLPRWGRRSRRDHRIRQK